MAKYRYVGLHADILDDGRPVAPGDFVNLSDEDALLPHAASLLADGYLAGTGEKSEQIQTTAEIRQTRAERELAKQNEEGGGS